MLSPCNTPALVHAVVFCWRQPSWRLFVLVPAGRRWASPVFTMYHFLCTWPMQAWPWVRCDVRSDFPVLRENSDLAHATRCTTMTRKVNGSLWTVAVALTLIFALMDHRSTPLHLDLMRVIRPCAADLCYSMIMRRLPKVQPIVYRLNT